MFNEDPSIVTGPRFVLDETKNKRLSVTDRRLFQFACSMSSD